MLCLKRPFHTVFVYYDHMQINPLLWIKHQGSEILSARGQVFIEKRKEIQLCVGLIFNLHAQASDKNKIMLNTDVIVYL